MNEIGKQKSNIKKQKKVDAINEYLCKRARIAYIDGAEDFVITRPEIFSALGFNLDSMSDDSAFKIARQKAKDIFGRELYLINESELSKLEIKNISEEDIVKLLRMKCLDTYKVVPIIPNGKMVNREREYHWINGDLQEARINQNIKSMTTLQINTLDYLIQTRDSLVDTNRRHIRQVAAGKIRMDRALKGKIGKISELIEKEKIKLLESSKTKDKIKDRTKKQEEK